MSGIIDWVDSSVLSGIDSTFSTTFSLTEKDSNLQLKRLRSASELDGDAEVLGYLWSRDISNVEDLQKYAASFFFCCPKGKGADGSIEM